MKLDDAIKTLKDTFTVEHKRLPLFDTAIKTIEEHIKEQEKKLNEINSIIEHYADGMYSGYTCINKISETINCKYE